MSSMRREGLGSLESGRPGADLDRTGLVQMKRFWRKVQQPRVAVAGRG